MHFLSLRGRVGVGECTWIFILQIGITVCRGSPAASHFFYFAKKSNQKKATPAAPAYGFLRLNASIGRLRNSHCVLKQSSPTTPDGGIHPQWRRWGGKAKFKNKHDAAKTRHHVKCLASSLWLLHTKCVKFDLVQYTDIISEAVCLEVGE